MDLKDFVTETISAIVEATNDLQARYYDEGILINPPTAQSGSDVFEPQSPNYRFRRVQQIAFDVAVSASDETAKDGKAGIRVLSVELGGGGSQATSHEKVSRVSFSVPITLKPTADEGRLAEKARSNRASNMKAMGVRHDPLK